MTGIPVVEELRAARERLQSILDNSLQVSGPDASEVERLAREALALLSGEESHLSPIEEGEERAARWADITAQGNPAPLLGGWHPCVVCTVPLPADWKPEKCRQCEAMVEAGADAAAYDALFKAGKAVLEPSESPTEPQRCASVGCSGHLVKTGPGQTPGSAGTYECDTCGPSAMATKEEEDEYPDYYNERTHQTTLPGDSVDVWADSIDYLLRRMKLVPEMAQGGTEPISTRCMALGTLHQAKQLERIASALEHIGSDARFCSVLGCGQERTHPVHE
jgi:hypothetical protein